MALKRPYSSGLQARSRSGAVVEPRTNPTNATIPVEPPSASGTVTSVGLSLPAIITVSGSPVTTAGTLTGVLATQAANLAWLGPASGAAAAPTFRALGTDDLPNVISAGGPTGDATHVAQITWDAKGRLTAVSSVAITGSASSLYFNVKDYGAVGDGSTDDIVAINAATAAAAAIATTGKGTVFFPGGDFKITGDIVLPGGFVGSIRFLGAGRRNSRIIQATSGKNGFNLDLSSGTRENNSAEVSDLGVYCSVATGLTAVLITYGTTNISSSENRSGSIVQRVDINNTAFTNNGTGWTDGVRMVNAWHHRISDCFCCLQQTGSGTVGTGAGFRASSGTNYSWDNLCVTIGNQAYLIDSVGAGQGAQGVLMNQLNAVSVDKFLNISGTSCQTIVLTNWQSDQEFQAVTSGIVATGVAALFVGYGNILIHTGTAITLSGCNNCTITNVRVDGVNTPIGIDIQSSTNNVNLRGNNYGGCATNQDVNIAASCGFIVSEDGQATDAGSNFSVIGRARAISTVKNLTGGSPSENIDVDTTACLLPGPATAAFASPSSGLPSLIIAQYDFASGSNSRTNARFVVSRSDGANLSAGNVRFSVLVSP